MNFFHDYFTHKPSYVPSGENLFISTVNGFDPEVSNGLQEILQGPTTPKFVFWLGDMSATKMLIDLENRFNDIHQAMEKLFKQNRKPSEYDLLRFPVRDGLLLADICRQFRAALKEIDPEYSSAYTANLAWSVWRYKRFSKFIEKLSLTAQEIIQRDQLRNAKDYVHLMIQFAKKGSQVIILEGDKDVAFPLGSCFKDLLPRENQKIRYFDKPGVIEDENYIFVIWPYNSKPSDIPYLNNPFKKKVVVVSHSPFVREAVLGTNPMEKTTDHVSKRDQEIDSYMLDVAQQLGANFGVHGDLHKPIDCGKFDAYCVGNFSAYFIYEGFKAIDF